MNFTVRLQYLKWTCINHNQEDLLLTDRFLLWSRICYPASVASQKAEILRNSYQKRTLSICMQEILRKNMVEDCMEQLLCILKMHRLLCDVTLLLGSCWCPFKRSSSVPKAQLDLFLPKLSPKCVHWVCHLNTPKTAASSKTTSRSSSMVCIVSVGTFATIVLQYSWCTKDGKSAC